MSKYSTHIVLQAIEQVKSSNAEKVKAFVESYALQIYNF